MSATFNFTGDYAIDQGADYGPVTILLNGSSGAPLSLTGASFSGQIRASHTGALLATLTIASVSGGIALSLPNSVTATLPDTASGVLFAYDIVMTQSDIKTRLISGTVQVNPSITQ